MRYEKFKSVILTFLVLVSIVLTWNLWTYQPNYATMDNTNTVAGVTVSEKQEVQKIVLPDQVLFHVNGDHYGTTNASELDKIIKDLEGWTFNDIKDETGKIGNLKEFVHGNGIVELVFPGDIPIELYQSVLNFKLKNVPAFNFNRIVINVGNFDKENGMVYFVSSDYQHVYMSHVPLSNLAEFTRDFYKSASHLPSYFAFNLSDKKPIFLPEDQTEMVEYRYLPVNLSSEDFKEALFSDPSFVQRSSTPQGEEYTNGTSKMTVNNILNQLLYVNPTPENNYTISSYDLLKRSIDFVNEHGGWTDPYHFVAKSEADKTVTFRLYSMDGYPVFNDNGSSEITEVWGRDEINKYIRPSIALDLPITSEEKKVVLPTGHDALAFLQSQKNYKPELLQQVVLGYTMEKDTQEQRLILLEPTWYYLYNKTWISMNELGGMKNGLE